MYRYIITLIAALLVGVSPTFAATWEGAAGISASADFPDNGYYAKSNVFPKNTTVEIQNLENGLAVNATISGALDTPGLIAALSKQAAQSLGIKDSQSTRVRITVPSAAAAAEKQSQSASGGNLSDPDVNPAAAIALDRAQYGTKNADAAPAAPKPQSEEPKPKTDGAPPVNEPPPQESRIGEAPAANVPPARADSDAETKAIVVPLLIDPASIAALQELTNGEPSPDTGALADAGNTEAEAPRTDEQVFAPARGRLVIESDSMRLPENARISENPLILGDSFVAVDQFNNTPETFAQNENPPESIADNRPAFDDAKPVNPRLSISASGEYEELFGAVFDEPTLAIADLPPQETPAAPQPPDEIDAFGERGEPEEFANERRLAEAAPQKDAPPEPKPETDSSRLAFRDDPTRVYDDAPIVRAETPKVYEDSPKLTFVEEIYLEPASALPPPHTETIGEKEAVIGLLEKPPVAGAEERGAQEPASENRLPFVEALDKNSYYIQIAALKDESSVRQLIENCYSYPISVQKAGDLLRVLVGPVTMDEYGAVLERFQSLGFKDAFLAATKP